MRVSLLLVFSIGILGTACTTGARDDFRFNPASLSTDTYSTSQLPQFQDFPVENRNDNLVNELDFTKAPEAVVYRAEMQEWVEQGVVFAGHYAIAQLSCGTGCQQIWIINSVDGLVSRAPFATSLGADYKIESALLIANPRHVIEEVYGEAAPPWLKTEYYVWNGVDFVKIFER